MSMTAATETLLDYKPLMLERRTFLKGVGVSLIAAPAIVRFDSIMPVRALPPELLQPPPKSWVDVWWCEPPCLSAPMQKWEDYLAGVKTVPDNALGKKDVIERAEYGIEVKRQRGDH